ncbi:DUF6230 family protein [Pullulanibacillus sp. KACC 23026]|uniref:DUF6230 family protein n=1 Tax=Pullulanibacillus sp. KACC 23026 TaxID=3028315 RepID=UPI0023B1F804|nr:DUF6230 family protein [Pullulanibacillus sp. KACC 23026]WEG14825.1 DUF6230 family protein [Pullulanibacillus sp. KACC 23026]
MDKLEAISSGERRVKRYSRKRFWGALISGFLFLGVIVGVFGLTGKAYALPMAGVGNFTVSFDKLVGSGYTFYPKLGETGTSSSAPLGRNKIDQLTVYGLKISKTLKLPTGQTIELDITASKPVQIKGLIQDASLLNGDASFSQLALQEHNTTDWTKEFTQSASQITLQHASLVTDYLYQDQVTLNGMTLSIHKVQ